MFKLNEYYRKKFTFSYLATKAGLEIDLVVERPAQRPIFIEIKSTDNVQKRHLQHLKSLGKDFPEFELYCFSQETNVRVDESVTIVPWQEGFKRMGLVAT